MTAEQERQMGELLLAARLWADSFRRYRRSGIGDPQFANLIDRFIYSESRLLDAVTVIEQHAAAAATAPHAQESQR